jgi:hypothetical protein
MWWKRQLTEFSSIFFLLIAVHGEGAVQVPQSSLQESGHQINSENEIATMNNLVENTLHQLEVQKQMRQLMVDFQKQKEEFARGNQTKAHAAQMVRTARFVYESIQAHHLQYLFSQEYLDELLFFSSIAGKNRIRSP